MYSGHEEEVGKLRMDPVAGPKGIHQILDKPREGFLGKAEGE